jgi:hypothetical protein
MSVAFTNSRDSDKRVALVATTFALLPTLHGLHQLR